MKSYKNVKKNSSPTTNANYCHVPNFETRNYLNVLLIFYTKVYYKSVFTCKTIEKETNSLNELFLFLISAVVINFNENV